MSSRYGRRCPGPWPFAVFAARRYARWLGSLLSLACIGWIIHRFVAGGVAARIMASADGRELAIHIAMAALAYTVGVGVLACAWSLLQGAFSRTHVPMGQTVGTYLVTQLGKYLPGNVAQYVGRHMLLRRHGLSHVALLCCTFAEAGLLAAAALLVAAPVVGRFIAWWQAGWGAALVLASVAAATLVFAELRKRFGGSRIAIDIFVPWRAWLAFMLYLVFFGVMGVTLLIVAGAEVRVHAGHAFLVASAALAWLAGYFVVGAPAGLGVREAVFLTLLRGSMPEDQVLLLVAMFRAATFGGDLLAFGLAAPFMRSGRAHKPP